MKKNKIYAVFGLGRYGSAVAHELASSGADVIAVDKDPVIVDSFASDFALCKCGDVTDPEVINQLGIKNADVVIIAMAENLEASVLATTHCKDVGVPYVIVKCANEMHKRILLRVGADKVTIPEQESGVRLSKNLLSSGFVDIIEVSKGISMAELEVRPEWVGKNLLELNLRRKYSLNIVAINNNGNFTTMINPEQPLEKTMKLIVLAEPAKMRKLS